MANAIVGSAIMVGFAALIGLPVGFFGGIYLAEFSGKTYGFLVRYMADLLNGVPSIVIGIFAWTVIVVPMHTLLGACRRFCVEPDADPHHHAQHRTVPAQRSADRCARARWRWARQSGR